jgi:hypothetical protein
VGRPTRRRTETVTDQWGLILDWKKKKKISQSFFWYSCFLCKAFKRLMRQLFKPWFHPTFHLLIFNVILV